MRKITGLSRRNRRETSKNIFLGVLNYLKRAERQVGCLPSAREECGTSANKIQTIAESGVHLLKRVAVVPSARSQKHSCFSLKSSLIVGTLHLQSPFHETRNTGVLWREGVWDFLPNLLFWCRKALSREEFFAVLILEHHRV